ncbi:hypothetical protein FRC17_003759 [Serendipita sp. 399]|nr:hypothetical protein FRC17_003759 [Serendipita sp. 399]
MSSLLEKNGEIMERTQATILRLETDIKPESTALRDQVSLLSRSLQYTATLISKIEKKFGNSIPEDAELPSALREWTKSVELRQATALRVESIVTLRRIIVRFNQRLLWLSLSNDVAASVMDRDPSSGVFWFIEAFRENPFAVHSNPSTISLLRPPDGVKEIVVKAAAVLGQSWVDMMTVETLFPSILHNLFRQLHITTSRLLFAQDMGWTSEETDEQGCFESFLHRLSSDLQLMLAEDPPTFTVVFVGNQNAGKSTLINALVGDVDLLPAGAAGVTALPCRIVHVKGLDTPTLQIKVDLLNEKLLELRQKVAAASEEDPYDRDNIEFAEKLKRHEQYTLPERSYGAQEAHNTLTWVNEIIRFSEIHGIAYNTLSGDTWAVIETCIPGLADADTSIRFELIDTPGLEEESEQYEEWKSLTHEIIQRASVIVAVIAGKRFYNYSWRDIPQLISGISNKRATIVVVTHLDTMSEPARDEIKRSITKNFWPESKKDPSKAGDIVECSGMLALLLWSFRRYLDGLTQLPPLSELNAGPHSYISKWLFRHADLYKYLKDMAHLKELIKESEDFANMEQTKDLVFGHLMSATRLRNPPEGVKQISNDIQAVLTAMEHHMANLGLVPRDTSPLQGELDRLEAQAMDARELFEHGQKTLSETNDYLLQRTTANLRVELDACIKSAIEATQMKMDERAKKSEPLVFTRELDVQRFIDTIQKELLKQLLLLHDQTVHSIREELGPLYERTVTDILLALRTFDSQAHEWARLRASPVSCQFTQPPSTKTIDTSSFVEKRPEGVTFRAAQERILASMQKQWTKAPGDQSRSLEKLNPIFRVLIAAIALIPFSLSLLHRAWSPRYLLDLEGLQKALEETISAPWRDTLSTELQTILRQCMENAKGGFEWVLQKRLDEDQDRLRELHRPPDVDPGVLWNVICNYCNLVSALEALSSLQT